MTEAPRDDNPTTNADGQDEHPGFAPDPTRIGLSLSGALPCYVCSYNLQGLSVTASCPECGAAVRATILYRVDPDAEAFQPVFTPRLTAIGLVLWASCGFLAACIAWSPRVIDLVERFVVQRAITPGTPLWIPRLLVALTALSGLGALAFIRPSKAVPKLASALAVVGALAYVPLAWALWRIHAVIDAGMASPYFVAAPRADRTALRMVVGGALLVIILALRPNARRLVQRSLALRKGRVDRQTLLGLAVAVAIVLAGDAMWLLAGSCPPSLRDVVADLGTILIAVGSLLFTIGAASAVMDGWRIARSVVLPAPSMKDILGSRARGPDND
ncbi:MAG: hypothetical protein EA379_04585 [Phycisphaerales bacterium]|nr:MAG: hypothetical protein EA379_04585 [Phycisphaerales bacterium]